MVMLHSCGKRPKVLALKRDSKRLKRPCNHLLSRLFLRQIPGNNSSRS